MKTEFSIKKIKCTQELIGKDIIIPATEEGVENLKSLKYNDKSLCVIKYTNHHSLERHDLLFACIKLISDNSELSELEIKEKLKIDARWIKGYVTYKDKHNQDRVNVITKSIAFPEMSLQDANEFYSKAFDILASYLGITTDELVREAKLRMKEKHYCELCGMPAHQKHHLLSQSKVNIEKYGKKLINADFNIRWLCGDCHSGHNKIPKELNWSENRFLKEAQSRGYLIDNLKDNIKNTFEGEEICSQMGIA